MRSSGASGKRSAGANERPFADRVKSQRSLHPRVEVEVVVEDRFVDILAEGYDAGVRLSEAIERDMVQVRLTDAFRCVFLRGEEQVAAAGIERACGSDPAQPSMALRGPVLL